jgi:hypothetical protein
MRLAGSNPHRRGAAPTLPMIRNSRSLRNACSLLCIVLTVLLLGRENWSLTLSGTHQWYPSMSLRSFCICFPPMRLAGSNPHGRGAADGDRNAGLSNANKSFADHRVTGDPPCSSPRRRAASTQTLESTNNHKPYIIERRCASRVRIRTAVGLPRAGRALGRGPWALTHPVGPDTPRGP